MNIFDKLFSKPTPPKEPSAPQVNKIKASGGTITVNGKTYHGTTVSVINDQVWIDGVLQDDEKLSGIVEVKITGDVSLVKSDAPVVIHGTVMGDVSSGGYVSCQSVEGSVSASGFVSCTNVGGNVKAGGYVDCENVKGDVKAGGYINKK